MAAFCVFGVITSLLLITGIAKTANANAVNRNPQVVDTQSILVPVTSSPPVQSSNPIPSNCNGYFPGTPGWNECFRQFSRSKPANPQNQEISQNRQNQPPMMNGVATGGFASTGQFGFNPFFSSGSSFINSNSLSTFDSFTGGYTIHAVNMLTSASLLNNMLHLTLYTGPIEKFDTKVNGNQLTITATSNGQEKLAQITIPEGIKVNDVKVERMTDSIYVTGPVSVNAGGSFQTFHSGSVGSGLGTGMFSQNMGQMSAGIMPPMQPMLDVNNMVNGIFQSISSMFQPWG